MQTIEPEFSNAASQHIYAAAATNASDTEAEGIGDLTFEMDDSPFASLMNKIERLLESGRDRDKIDAFDLIKTALREGLFEGRQAEKLTEKLEEVIDDLHADRALGKAFTKGTFGIQPREDGPAVPGASPALNFAP